jgi:hypothetical protein
MAFEHGTKADQLVLGKGVHDDLLPSAEPCWRPIQGCWASSQAKAIWPEVACYTELLQNRGALAPCEMVNPSRVTVAPNPDVPHR